MITIEESLAHDLCLPSDGLTYEVSRWVTHTFADKYVLETEDGSFDLRAYVTAGKCKSWLSDLVHAHVEAEWQLGRKAGRQTLRNGLSEIEWRGLKLRVLSLDYSYETKRHYIIADNQKDARAFFSAVCSYCSEVQGEILVFKSGMWIRDALLHKQIKSTSFENLILRGSLKEDLIAECEGFFASREGYKQYGVAWKRGVLLLGPPGNGKTHAVKALVNHLNKPCLYVRNLQAHKRTPQQSLDSIFSRARAVAPCVLVFEDLDSIVDSDCRSFFLNELDGFASNEGLLTIATTNHPEKLDTAILNRPSRFDRKMTFALPGRAERVRFLTAANERVDPALRMQESEIEAIAKLTKGFSFAYLKELCVSSLMGWMLRCEAGSMGSVMRGLVSSLRREMASKTKQSKGDDEE